MGGISGGQLVATAKGLVPISTLGAAGLALPAIDTGRKRIVELSFSDGGVFRCCESQRILGA